MKISPAVDTLYVQIDGCGDNVNNAVMVYLQLLIEAGRFKEIELNRLPVGHTHEDIGLIFLVQFVANYFYFVESDQMFSCISRALRGDSRTKKAVQLHTPEDFDNFLRSEVFEGGITVTRVHAIPNMKSLLDDIGNPNTRGLGHQGWRPGHVLQSQRVSMLARLAREAPDKHMEMVTNNSLIVPEATAAFILEDFNVLLAMAKGHDGKNPNHCIRFVWDPTANRSVTQYKHFSFEDVWRPTLKFSRESGRWVPDTDVRYSWLKADLDLSQVFVQEVPTKMCRQDPVPQSVRDNVTKCVNTMANFGPAQLQKWNQYFDEVLSLQRNLAATIPYVSPIIMAQKCKDVTAQPINPGGNQTGVLALTSTIGSHSRETLVAATALEAAAWSNDQADLRLTSRVSRVDPSGEPFSFCLNLNF